MTNKPEVVCHAVKAVGAPVTLRFIVREDVADEYMSKLSERSPVVSSSPLIRLSDYKALQAENEKLRAAMIEAKGHISHYMHGGSSYREPAAKAVALIDAALQGDQT